MNTVEDTEVVKSANEESCTNSEESSQLSHQELIKLTKMAIDNIIESDPLLSGLPSDVTIEELRSQIAVAQGQAITLFIDRGRLPKLAVVVIYCRPIKLYIKIVPYNTSYYISFKRFIRTTRRSWI